jgi:hypothetical protein
MRYLNRAINKVVNGENNVKLGEIKAVAVETGDYSYKIDVYKKDIHISTVNVYYGTEIKVDTSYSINDFTKNEIESILYDIYGVEKS